MVIGNSDISVNYVIVCLWVSWCMFCVFLLCQSVSLFSELSESSSAHQLLWVASFISCSFFAKENNKQVKHRVKTDRHDNARTINIQHLSYSTLKIRVLEHASMFVVVRNRTYCMNLYLITSISANFNIQYSKNMWRCKLNLILYSVKNFLSISKKRGRTNFCEVEIMQEDVHCQGHKAEWNLACQAVLVSQISTYWC